MKSAWPETGGTPGSASSNADVHRPRSSQTVSVSLDDRLQLQVSQCVETKTITTTTTTKRTFPSSVFLREPRPLESLDAKEYPLATKPTPPELATFSFELPAGEAELGKEAMNVDTENAPGPAGSNRALSADRVRQEEILPARRSPSPAASPSEAAARRTRHRSHRSTSPVSEPSTLRAPHRTIRSSSQQLNAVSDKLRRTVLYSTRRENERTARQSSGCLATPDATDSPLRVLDRPSRLRPLSLERSRDAPESGPSQMSVPCDQGSPVGSDFHTVFSGSVATPPITDADQEPFADADESLQQAIRSHQLSRPTIDVVAAQDASLPSPRLSPTLAVPQLHADSRDRMSDDDENHDSSQWLEDSQITDDGDSLGLVRAPRHAVSAFEHEDQATALDPRLMVEAFDSMPDPMKNFMMYQLLRRCPRTTLRVIANAVNPVLKADFLRHLPLELSYHVLSYLDHVDLCRAAQVSKTWRHVVDCNETGWKDLFDRDGFVLAPGELEKAIVQGWGWQDPVGFDGAEQDLSVQARLKSSEAELTKSAREAAPKLRSSKRKRGPSYISGPSSKRRGAVSFTSSGEKTAQAQGSRSEGPVTAASAAIAAIPDPGPLNNGGLPGLARMHLFKSLYRRHYMIRQSWTNGKVKPGHVAFAAHPRHVITCLQFDEDKIITGSDDMLIHVYDTKTGKLRKKLEGHEGGVWALQYEGNMLVSGSTDRSVRVWDIEKGLCTQVFFGHTSTVRCLQILMPTEVGRSHTGTPIMMPPKPIIITGSRDHQLRVWRLPEVGSRRYIQTGPPANDMDCPYFLRTLAGHTNSVRAISAHADTLVSGSYDGTVRVWRIHSGDCVHVLQGHSQKVYSVILDHERNRCISGSMDSLVKIWDLASGSCLYTLEGHSLLVGLLDLRDQRLVSAAADSTLRIWDPETGKCKNVLEAHTGAITCFQHDGRKVVSGSEKTVKMWDVQTGDFIQDLLTDLSGVWQVKFDQRRCVAAVQRDGITYVEILDFGAARDGETRLGERRVLNEPEVARLIAEEA